MIEIKRNEAMSKAIERAKARHPKVIVVNATARAYVVTGSRGDNYLVRFEVVNGRKLASCTCKAGERGSLCYHVAAAAAVNLGIQAMRAQLAQQAAKCAHKDTTLDVRGSRWIGEYGVEDDYEEFVVCRDCGETLA